MLQSASMKQTLRYDQLSCRLRVDGLPDVSTGQDSASIGIITGWTLEWVGHPQLEGRRDHLLALMQVVLPYARHLISRVARPFGGGDLPVSIAPDPAGQHRLSLRSSQPDTPPLEVTLDDAELADLVRALDQLRLDPRLKLTLPIPAPEPLRARELMDRVPLQRRLAAPLGGAVALILTAGVAALLPTPQPTAPSPSGEAAPALGEDSAAPAR